MTKYTDHQIAEICENLSSPKYNKLCLKLTTQEFDKQLAPWDDLILNENEDERDAQLEPDFKQDQRVW